METYSRKVRKFSIITLDNIKEILKVRYNINNDLDITYETFSFFLIFNQSDMAQKIVETLPGGGYDHNEIPKVILPLVIVQLYTDLYQKLRYEEKIGNIDENSKKILNIVSSIKSYKEILEMIDDTLIFGKAVDASHNFDLMPAFDKVLQIKSLDSKDLELLEKLNPFFAEEREKFDIKVDKDFIFKHISLWQKRFKDDTSVSYSAATNFIFDLYKLREPEAIDVVISILYDLDIEPKEFSSSDDNDDTINVNGVKISKMNLIKILKNYFDKYSDTNSLNYTKKD